MKHTTVPQTKPIALNAVMSYAHPGLVARLEQKLSLTKEDAALLFEDTKRFLFMCATNPGRRIAPPEMVDEGWHNFILFTRDYAQFCRRYLGRFIHHAPQSMFNPAKKKQSRKEVLESTHTLILNTFGKLPSKFWRGADAMCSDGPSCTSSVA